VLPEHTIGETSDENHWLIRASKQIARNHDTFICIGADARAVRGQKCDYDNVGMLIDPHGKILLQQSKLVPLPFFIDGNPGKSQITAATPFGTVGVFVCYDGLFTDIPRRLADQGAELFLVPNMDPDRWPEQERNQHASMAPFRSIELRRCAARSN